MGACGRSQVKYPGFLWGMATCQRIVLSGCAPPTLQSPGLNLVDFVDFNRSAAGTRCFKGDLYFQRCTRTDEAMRVLRISHPPCASSLCP